MLKKTLNLPDTIHCLFLSQFDTEHAFRQDLRWALTLLFFNLAGDFCFVQCFGTGLGETFLGGSIKEAVSLQGSLQRASRNEIAPRSVAF